MRAFDRLRSATGCDLQPQHAGSGGRIDTGLLPPGDFIATAMHLAMVSPAERYGELVADLAAKCQRLGKAQMMSIRGTPAADQARLLGNRFDVIPVANPAWRGQGQNAFVDSGDRGAASCLDGLDVSARCVEGPSAASVTMIVSRA